MEDSATPVEELHNGDPLARNRYAPQFINSPLEGGEVGLVVDAGFVHVVKDLLGCKIADQFGVCDFRRSLQAKE